MVRLERLTFIKRSSIKTSSRLSQTKKANPKTQTPYFTLTSTTSLQLPSPTDKNTDFQTLTSTSLLQLHSHTDQNTVFQINKHTKKKIPKGSEKKKRLCLSSATGKIEKLSSSSAKTGDLEDNSEGRYGFSPFFVFNSITVSRVLKIRVNLLMISLKLKSIWC